MIKYLACRHHLHSYKRYMLTIDTVLGQEVYEICIQLPSIANSYKGVKLHCHRGRKSSLYLINDIPQIAGSANKSH